MRGHLPQGTNGELLLQMMERSRELLRDHPVNQKRIERGLNPANCCWFWGEGRKPSLKKFEELYHKTGAVVSAVDLIKGIGLCAGLDSIDVAGATGNIHTNFRGKAQAGIDALLKDDKDFVYIHLEAPDECGHRAETENKVRSIELIDEQVVRPRGGGHAPGGGRLLPAAHARPSHPHFYPHPCPGCGTLPALPQQSGGEGRPLLL